MNIGKTPSFGAIHIIDGKKDKMYSFEVKRNDSASEINEATEVWRKHSAENLVTLLKNKFCNTHLNKDITVENRLQNKGFAVVGPLDLRMSDKNDKRMVVITNSNSVEFNNTAPYKEYLTNKKDLYWWQKKTENNPDQTLDEWVHDRKEAGAEIIHHELY